MIDARVYIADISALKEKATFDRLYSTMPVYRKKKIDRLKVEDDQILSLGVGLLLKRACEDFGIAGADEHVACLRNGKPYFTDCPQVHFNLSHSHERVMCVMSPYVVGCDVEKVRKNRLHVAKNAYSASEQEWICRQKGSAAQCEAFYRLWTLKESYMKATGLGFDLNPGSFALRMEGPRVLLEHDGLRPEYVFREFSYVDGYRYACCFENSPVGCVLDVERLCR